MKRLKLITVMLALLLAAMVMVPMVSAGEQTSNGDNFQLPHLQLDNSQPKVVIQNGFSFSKSNNQTPIPEGAIIQHTENGITRVFDSNGKQLIISNDIESSKIPTPYGYISAAKITQVPEGSFIQENDNGTTNIYLKDKRILTILNPASTKTQIPSSSGWIESSQSWGISNMGQFIADWVVPSSPPNSQTGAINYIFNGIQPSGGGGIVQPVLEYNVYGTNHQWTATPWYVDQYVNGYYGNRISTASGHMIRGTLGWNSNLNRWNIMVSDLSNGGYSSEFSTNAPNIGTNNVAAVCALEGYYINNNNDVSGTMAFQNMKFKDVNLNPISFSWSSQINNNMGLTNLGVTWSGMTPVVLWTANT